MSPVRAQLSVQWWEGVHFTGTPVWCDAQRVRDVCFVSHAYAAGAMRHGQLIGTRQTLSLLARKQRRQQPESVLPVPCNRPFTLGEMRFELFNSGHAIGSASLSVQRGGTRVVYAGAVNPHGGGLGGKADVRRCDALVVDARYGHPKYAFPEPRDARDAVVDFALTALSTGSVPVLLVTSPAKGLDVAHQLTHMCPVRAHRAIHHAAQRLRADGETVPRLKRWAGKLPRGEVVLWLADAVRTPALRAGDPETRVALVSGSALDPERIAELGVERGFAWSNCADYGELLRYIDATGAQRVFATGRYADYLATRLDNVTPLGPPRQLRLF